MTTAIHYTSVKAPPKAGQVYGLQVAVLDWLRGYMRYSGQEKLFFLIDSEAAANEIKEIAAEVGVEPERIQMLDSRFEQNLNAFDQVFRADTDPHDLFWQRNRLGKEKGFSFCGIAHAVAGREGAEVLARYCEGPSSDADAIICPSHAIKSVIQNYFDHYGAYVSQQFGAAYSCPIDLPVVPLGVNTKRIEDAVSPDKRSHQRMVLGVEEGDIVLLWVGRLSYAIKAHPIAMFRAAEKAAQQAGQKVHLVLQGYFVPENADEEFAKLAADICPTVKVHFIASDDVAFPDGLWAAGDIFLSLIDNVQESFGLTPVEAIAAGLPRVVSDWDGYRDGVEDGVDGFLIPTYSPPPGSGDDLAALLLAGRESYGGALAQIAQTAAVDHEVAADVIIRLIKEPDLRKRLAQKAKERLPIYDWKSVIPAYEEVWAQQKARRQNIKPLKLVHPHAADPCAMYSAFPTRALGAGDVLSLALPQDDINKLLQHSMNTLAMGVLVPVSSLTILMNVFAKEVTASTAFTVLDGEDPARIWRTLCWLVKLGILNKKQSL